MRDNHIEIYVDSGHHRTTDITKALYLGAKGVGIGRLFLYTMSTYGLPGIHRAMQLLKGKMEMNMRLIECSSVDQLNPTLIDARRLSTHITASLVNVLGMNVYDPTMSHR